MLSTIQWNWGLAPLANTADTLNVKPMTEFFVNANSATKKTAANTKGKGKTKKK